MRLRLLGPLELVVDGSVVAIGAPKERLVLTLLGLHANRVVAEETLIEALWGDDLPRTASRTLQALVSRLRRALGPPEHGALAVATRSGGYELVAPPGAIDVDVFAQLATEAAAALHAGDPARAAAGFADALALWRGDPLAEFADAHFAVAETARLRELHLTMIEQRLEAELACGNHRGVVPEVEALTGAYPLREQLWALRMLALYRSGRQADALRAYQQVREMLRSELGLEPSRELRAMEQAVLAQSPDLDWQRGEADEEKATVSSTGVVTLSSGMNEPRIQYVRTVDDVSIAYAVFGEGPPVVFPSNIWGDVHLIQCGPPHRRLMVERLVALGRQVIAFDGRGMGSSDRHALDFSLEARLHDLEAVIDRLGLERFVLCGRDHGAPTAVAYAVAHPENVSHLILVEAFFPEVDPDATVPVLRAVESMRDMAEQQWEHFTLTLASLVAGISDDEQATKFAQAFRTGMSAGAFLLLSDASKDIEVGSALSSITVPTLVVHNTSFVIGGPDLSRAIASSIPGAELVTTSDPPQAIDAFLGPATDAEAPVQRSTAIILFADIVDSTALTERLGDRAFRDRARRLDVALRSAIARSKGTTVEGKLLGDGVLATFVAARDAIGAAASCSDEAAELGLELHVGIHAGDVIREAGNIFGGAVNIAARISALSAPREVLVSETVRSLARTSAGASFEDRGEHSLKGIDDPVRIWAVREFPPAERST